MDRLKKNWHWVVFGFAAVSAVAPVLAGEPKLAAVAAGLLALERIFLALKPAVEQEVGKDE